jgi:hypothetical protein
MHQLFSEIPSGARDPYPIGRIARIAKDRQVFCRVSGFGLAGSRLAILAVLAVFGNPGNRQS